MNRWIWRDRLETPLLLLLMLAVFNAMPVFASQIEDRWWPVQAFPKAVVRTSNQQEFPEPRAAL